MRVAYIATMLHEEIRHSTFRQVIGNAEISSRHRGAPSRSASPVAGNRFPDWWNHVETNKSTLVTPLHRDFLVHEPVLFVLSELVHRVM